MDKINKYKIDCGEHLSNQEDNELAEPIIKKEKTEAAQKEEQYKKRIIRKLRILDDICIISIAACLFAYFYVLLHAKDNYDFPFTLTAITDVFAGITILLVGNDKYWKMFCLGDLYIMVGSFICAVIVPHFTEADIYEVVIYLVGFTWIVVTAIISIKEIVTREKSYKFEDYKELKKLDYDVYVGEIFLEVIKVAFFAIIMGMTRPLLYFILYCSYPIQHIIVGMLNHEIKYTRSEMIWIFIIAFTAITALLIVLHLQVFSKSANANDADAKEESSESSTHINKNESVYTKDTLPESVEFSTNDTAENDAAEKRNNFEKGVMIVAFVTIIVVVATIGIWYHVEQTKAHEAEVRQQQEERYQKNRKKYVAKYKNAIEDATEISPENDIYVAYVTDLNNSGELQQNVKFNCEMTDYQHLGEEITETLTYNGEELNPYETNTLNVTPNSAFTLTITENDSIPDTATKNIEVGDLNSDEYINGYSLNGNLTVNERGGRRYPNAYATFEYNIDIVPNVNEDSFKKYAKVQVQNTDYWKSKDEKYDIF